MSPEPEPSPLIGAFFLSDLDRRMERSGLPYGRFMDDVLVLAPSRWKLRRAVRAVNEILQSLGLEKHPDKTFIGRIEKGFDFLGYHFGPHGLSVAKKTIAAFLENASRLYEQERRAPSARALEMYIRRWLRWARGGLRPHPDPSLPAAYVEAECRRQPTPNNPAIAVPNR